MWHQMVPAERAVLPKLIEEFERRNPGVTVRYLYKENEELRAGFQAAALANSGPDVVYGPSDNVGVFAAMDIVRDLKVFIPDEEVAKFDPRTVVYRRDARLRGQQDSPRNDELLFVGDRIGNHLMLIYNRLLLPEPPKTTDEMIEAAARLTRRVETESGEYSDVEATQYGLVWNFTEPFFIAPFITGCGGWVFDREAAEPMPDLASQEVVDAFALLQQIVVERKVTPRNVDYNSAVSLFKSGDAAMHINGDWSLSEFFDNDGVDPEKLDPAIAVLPIVSATGRPLAPLVAPKGYSMSAEVPDEKAPLVGKFIRYMTSAEVQRQLLRDLKTIPSRTAERDREIIDADPVLRMSFAQLERGELMPVEPELRIIWDAMRPGYQRLISGEAKPKETAEAVQREATRGIVRLYERPEPGWVAKALPLLALAGLLMLLWWQRHAFYRFFADWQDSRFAYLLCLPTAVLIVATIAYPFFYNVVLSFSDMSLTSFRDWQIVGLQNYQSVATESAGDANWWETRFLVLFAKTVVWTVVNVVFHVGLGLMLALALNGVRHGKSIYRVLLIIPWAVPAYITALTWRGEFNPEFGSVNLILRLFVPEGVEWAGVDWLGQATPAFMACILTNIWLGFPFMMVIALGGMQGIPQELYEAARIDRASRWQQFKLITLPLLKPVLLPATTLGAIWTFNNLNVVWLVSNGGEPSDKTHILVSYVYKATFNAYRYGYGAALSMVIFAILLVFSQIFLQKNRATEAVA